MAFKPNYNQQRAERDRLKRAKREEKLRLQAERTAQRKGTEDGEAGGEGDAGTRTPRTSVASRGESTERAFLAQCIAESESGARALGELDLSAHFTSDLLRRAAGHLRAHLTDPGAQLPEDDPELAVLLAELVVQAGREVPAPAMLESQRMQLELARIDREIQRARGQESGDVSELALRRAEVKREFDLAYERALEETV